MNISAADLNQKTVKELVLLAKELGISGLRRLRKSDLVRLILNKKRESPKSSGENREKAPDANVSRRQKSASKSGSSKSKKTTTSVDAAPDEGRKSSSKKRSDKKEAKKPVESQEKSKKSEEKLKPTSKSAKTPKQHTEEPSGVSQPLSTPVRQESATEQGTVSSKFNDSFSKARDISGIYEEIDGINRDRFVLLVRDPYWLHVYWELCTRLIERAKAAMGHSWHTSVPVLRLFQIVADGINNPRRDHIRDVRIHGGVNNWYIDVQNPPGTFQVEIGFLSREGNFFPISSSNIVQTPQSQVISGTNLDGHWESVSEDFDRIYKLSGGGAESSGQLRAVFEEQLQRSMSTPLISRFGARSAGFERTKRHFPFIVDADVVIYGKTDPSVQISIKGEPIAVENNGNFSVRYTLAEKRQVFPIEAKGSDGIETQQVIVAIDRNTKTLETVFLDNDEDD